MKKGGFVCSVSGKRRGKGSSREQSPYAELMAGIRVVIAENIERIYNENCQNLGILTSTDFSLIDRIRSGEEIALDEFTADVDPITRQIIEYGGLFEYNVARLQGKVTLPPVHSQLQGGGRRGHERHARHADEHGGGERQRQVRHRRQHEHGEDEAPPGRGVCGTALACGDGQGVD